MWEWSNQHHLWNTLVFQFIRAQVVADGIGIPLGSR